MPIRDFSITRDILRFEGADPGAYWRRFAMLLTLAVTIATMGLLRDSGAVVIAAMLIAPLMTPILGIASSMVMGWLGRALWLALVVLFAAGVSVCIAWAIAWAIDAPRGVTLPVEVGSRTHPGAEDLLIALAAGVAGAYVQIQKSEISLLPGAAIGVSLVPPLAAAGLLLHFGEPLRAREAVLLFATNFGAIIFSACIVYIASSPSSFLLSRGRRRMRFTMSATIATAFLVAVFLHLLTTTYYRYVETRTEAALAAHIRRWAGSVPVEVLRVEVHARDRMAEIWALVDLPSDAQYRIASAADLLPASLARNPFRSTVREVLGPDYTVVVRYQTRIAWQIDLADESLHPAPVLLLREDE
ncbi:DUF389 domain-containing protein [Oceanicella sp. SM1341]|uniref:DUF389 domain-containing protein n=1 Tax=Oceanicella sp. SM1341 TaxID=1548889 RepID=UPI00130017BB|nr:DUF389 domain-containing protein [Oceanicella sp. SM1341]